MGTFNMFRIAGFAGGPLIAATVVVSGPYTIAGFTFSGFAAAFGPLSSGALIQFGFVVPFPFGAVLAAISAVLVYTQIEETVGPPSPNGISDVTAHTTDAVRS